MDEPENSESESDDGFYSEEETPEKFSCSRLVFLGQETKKKKKTKLFYLEKKLLELQRPELLWNCIGIVSQLINGSIFPAILLVFSEIFNLFNVTDETEQRNKALVYMAIILALAVVNFIVVFGYNYAFTYAGAKLTTRYYYLD